MTSMRERIARALWFFDAEPHGFRPSQWEFVECKDYYFTRIDAILAEMETPSDDVIAEGEASIEYPSDLYAAWSAMIRAIRDGK